MKKHRLIKLVLVAMLSALLSGCVVWPGWGHDGWHGHHGHHHHGEYHGGHGGYDWDD